LRDPSRPATAVSTTTLEMGIDIGTVHSVAQVGPPPSVAALRQRLGRSGRRGEPAILRIYVTEPTVDPRTSLPDQLRAGLVQSIAMLDLLEGWCEPPDQDALHLSTLTQQVMSAIAQHGGVTPTAAYRALCGPGSS
jgi:ATP-dependent helicase Lhr and Lhr-like helicase